MTSPDHRDGHAAVHTAAAPTDGLPQPALPGLEELADPGYSGTHAARIVGITYRQLDYWARTDLIRPSLSDASGSGSRRRYSYGDLLELRVIKTLLDAGIKLESVREVFTYLRDHLATDIASAHLVISGNSVVLCDGSELIDVLNRGQGVLNVLSLAGVKGDIDARLVPFAEEDLADDDPGLRRPRRTARADGRPLAGPATGRRVV